jgi:hypothetical protein
MKTLTQSVRAFGAICSLACTALSAQAAQPKPYSPEITQIRVGTSNVFVVKSDPHVLIDSGEKKDLNALLTELKAEGIAMAMPIMRVQRPSCAVAAVRCWWQVLTTP